MQDLTALAKDPNYLPKLFDLPKRLAKYCSIQTTETKMIVDGNRNVLINVNCKTMSHTEVQAKFNNSFFKFTYDGVKVYITGIDPVLLENPDILINLKTEETKRKDTEPGNLQTLTDTIIPSSSTSRPPSLAVSSLYAPAPKPTLQPITNSSDNFASLFANTYEALLKSTLEKERKATIAKLAGYAIVRQLVEMSEKEGLKLSYVGRIKTEIHPAHANEFQVQPELYKFNNDISRLHFVVAENSAGLRIIIDLGSPGTWVQYLEAVSDEDFNNSYLWFISICKKVQNQLEKDEDKTYQTICPLYARIKNETVGYVEKATTVGLEKPAKGGYPMKLKTDLDNIGWLPLPRGYNHILTIGGQIKITVRKGNDQPLEIKPNSLTHP